MPTESGFGRHALAALFRRRRLRTIDDLAEFAQVQALRVAQASLLEYLRARMGTRWPVHFTDPTFAPVIRQAQAEGFRICLADLVVYALARTGGDADAARLVFARATGGATDGIEGRLTGDGWQNAATAFRPSEQTLIDVAPVTRAFRDEDREAFANALALRWVEVRRKFAAQGDLDALRRALETLPQTRNTDRSN